MGNLCNLTKALWMSPQLPNQKWYLSFQIEERYHPSFWDDKSTSESGKVTQQIIVILVYSTENCDT